METTTVPKKHIKEEVIEEESAEEAVASHRRSLEDAKAGRIKYS